MSITRGTLLSLVLLGAAVLLAPAGAWAQATNLVCAQCVDTGDIADQAVTGNKLGQGSILTGKYADGSVTGNKLANGSILTSKFADQSVTGNKIAQGAILAGKLANGAVRTGKIFDGAVTNAKIGDAAVTGSKLAAGAVTGAKIANGAVTGAKIAPATITADKLDLAISPTGTRIPVDACGTIDQPGSYLVTQNLTATGDCLVIAANFVTLDLNGFALSGNGTGDGVVDDELGRRGLVVRNGTIENFFNAVSFVDATDCIIDDLRALDSTSTGISSGDGCRVTNNIVAGSGGRNISTGDANLVSRNVVEGAGFDGITVGRGSIVSENIVSGNGGAGVVLAQGTLATSNAISQNTLFGIDTSELPTGLNKTDSTVTNNVVVENDDGGINYGKVSSDGLLVANNTFRSNSPGGNSVGNCDQCTIAHNVGAGP